MDGTEKGTENREAAELSTDPTQQNETVQQQEQQNEEQQQQPPPQQPPPPYQQPPPFYNYGYAQQMPPEMNQMQPPMPMPAPPPPPFGYHGAPPPQSYGYHYPVPPMDGVPLPLPPGIPGLGGSTDPLEAVLGPFPCARLRNLPYDVVIEDILLLFQGLVVIDIVQVGHREAYVIFANPMDYQMALQRDRQTISRQFVDIAAATRDQYYAAIAKIHMQEQDGGRMTSSNRSSSLGRDDGVDESAASAGSSSLWGTSSSPTPSSNVIGSLGGSSLYSDSLPSSHLSQSQSLAPQQNLGSIGLTGRGGTRPALHAPLQKRTGGGIQVGEHTGFLRMRGLPFSSTKEDIFHFFEGYHPVQESIVLTYRNDGRATGEAYVGFASPDDSKRAMELHRRMMGSRYIELFISNKDEQGRALARFGNR